MNTTETKPRCRLRGGEEVEGLSRRAPSPIGEAGMNAPSRLATIARTIKARELPSVEDAAWLANAVAQIEQGESAAHALEVARAPGQRSIATEFQTTCRNQFVPMAAAKVFANQSKRQQAIHFAAGLSRYRNSGGWWRGDDAKPECPHRPGRPEFYYWHILKAVDRDLSWHTIYRLLLSHELGGFE